MREVATAAPSKPSTDADIFVISDPPALAAAFACAVTVLTKPERLVARNGDLSIFSAYRRIFPQARLDGIAILNYFINRYFINIRFPSQAVQQGSRRCPIKGKIARLEFNKVLQSKCGYICTRSRKKSISM